MVTKKEAIELPPDALRELVDDEELVAKMEGKLLGTTWHSQDKGVMKIVDMDDGHLINSIKMIGRGADADGRRVSPAVKEKLAALLAEWEHRGRPVEDPRRNARRRRFLKNKKDEED